MNSKREPSSFAGKVIDFYSTLDLKLPKELHIDILNPYQNTAVLNCVNEFFKKYFNDQRKRIYLLGINPGRFGGGITGISFTDPVALREICGIENDLGKKRELSSEFIYRVIDGLGGPEKFYHNFFLSAVCPLGFIKGAVNYNYYDDKRLQEAVLPFIQKTFLEQIKIGAQPDILICIGTGKNKKFIEQLNGESKFFKKIISLEHPRFIMQYRRKRLMEYIDLYIQTLGKFT